MGVKNERTLKRGNEVTLNGKKEIKGRKIKNGNRRKRNRKRERER